MSRRSCPFVLSFQRSLSVLPELSYSSPSSLLPLFSAPYFRFFWLSLLSFPSFLSPALNVKSVQNGVLSLLHSPFFRKPAKPYTSGREKAFTDIKNFLQKGM